LTVLGLVVLWPRGGAQAPAQPLARTLPADVEDVRETDCNAPTRQRCREILIRVGRDRSELDLGPITAALEVSAGDAVRVTAVPRVAGLPQPPDAPRYSFVDVERRGPILIALTTVAVLALILLRWRGLLATLGVLVSLLLLKFIVPALLDGRPAILVALTGSLAVMFVTVTLTNGLGAQTMAAALGITATLLLACGLAAAGVQLASLDGRGDDLALALGQQTESAR
jgi:YibE/F-like protein